MADRPGTPPRPARQAGRRQGHAGRALSRALRHRAPLDRRPVPRRGRAGHAGRARGAGLHGPRRARPRRHRGRRRRGALRRRRTARGRLRPRRLPAHRAAGRGARAGPRPATRSTSSIDLDVPTEIVLDRIAGRRVCVQLRRHVPRRPAAQGQLDRATCAAAQVVQREDDTEDAVDAPPRALRAADHAAHRLLPERSGCSWSSTASATATRSRRAWSTRSTARFDPAVRDHPQDRRTRSRSCGAPAGSSPRCTRCASAPPSRARRPLDVDARRPRGPRATRRPLELPRLPRVPGGDLHVAQRRHRARHPERRRRARGRRHPLDRLRRDHRGLARRRRDHGPDRRRSTTSRSGSSTSRGARSRPRSTRWSRATDSATSAPRSRASPSGPGSRSCASTSATASAPPCTRTRRSRTTGPAGQGMKLKEGHGARHRADGERRHAPRPRSSTTAGPSSPRDGRRSAHFEHTIAVTDHGPEVLTLPWYAPANVRLSLRRLTI